MILTCSFVPHLARNYRELLNCTLSPRQVWSYARTQNPSNKVPYLPEFKILFSFLAHAPKVLDFGDHKDENDDSVDSVESYVASEHEADYDEKDHDDHQGHDDHHHNHDHGHNHKNGDQSDHDDQEAEVDHTDDHDHDDLDDNEDDDDYITDANGRKKKDGHKDDQDGHDDVFDLKEESDLKDEGDHNVKGDHKHINHKHHTNHKSGEHKNGDQKFHGKHNGNHKHHGDHHGDHIDNHEDHHGHHKHSHHKHGHHNENRKHHGDDKDDYDHEGHSEHEDTHDDDLFPFHSYETDHGLEPLNTSRSNNSGSDLGEDQESSEVHVADHFEHFADIHEEEDESYDHKSSTSTEKGVSSALTSAKDAISKFSEYIHHLAKKVADKLGYDAVEEDSDDDHMVGQYEDDYDDYGETEIEGWVKLAPKWRLELGLMNGV